MQLNIVCYGHCPVERFVRLGSVTRTSSMCSVPGNVDTPGGRIRVNLEADASMFLDRDFRRTQIDGIKEYAFAANRVHNPR